jgi:hypothetical protein
MPRSGESKTKAQLIAEWGEARRRVMELEIFYRPRV